MARLKNYGPGEISDRLSILSLKRLFGAEAGKDCTAFQNEWGILLTEIRVRTLNGKWFEAVLELAAVNAALWHAEDDLRDYGRQYGAAGHDRAFTDPAVADLALRIQRLNDQRAALIDRINKDAGETLTSDKVFRETVRETKGEDE